MDEARHVEAYSRLLHEKVKLAYPITRRWPSSSRPRSPIGAGDMTYLGMQILIEGLALAAFQRLRVRRATRCAPRSTPTSCRTRRATWRSAGSPCASSTRSSPRAERDEREEFARRGVLPDARPVQPARGLGEPRPAARRVPRGGRALQHDGAVPAPPVHAHRSHRQGHRAVGQAGPQGV